LIFKPFSPTPGSAEHQHYGDYLTAIPHQDWSPQFPHLPNLITDIEQPLTRRNLIKPTDLFPKQAKDFDLYLVQPFNEVVQLALHGHADAMNPFE